MVERQLRGRDIEDERVLEAMGRVPREPFVPEAERRRAYADAALPIGHGQTISQPYMVARIAESLSLQPGERVLDLACGTGVVARLAAQRVGPGGSVAGQDLNPGMLAVARSTAAPIEWHESDAQAMPFSDHAFDVALCQLGLQFFGDRAAALREVRRVLVPGGRLVANVPGPTPRLFVIFEDAIRHHVSPEVAGFLAAVFSLHDAAELEHLLDDAGFQDVAVDARTKSLPLPPPADFLWQYAASTPLAAAVGALDEAGRSALKHAVVGQWERLADGELVLELRVVTVTGRSPMA